MIRKLTPFLLSMALLFWSSTQAQIQNCGLAAGSGGSLSSTELTVCNDGTLWGPPTLSGYTAGLEITEYVFQNPSNILFTDDSTLSGPEIIEINTTGIFDPQAAGLLEGESFVVTAVSYNLSDLQSFTDILLTGSFLFTSCCTWASSLGGAGDVCSVYNAVGINSGSDIQGLEDVLLYINGFGGPSIVSNVLFSLDETNASAGLPCADSPPLPICYASSDDLTIDVVCAPAGCSSATPPTGLSSTAGASAVDLNWDPLSGSVGCQVAAEQIPSGPSPSQNVLGTEVSSTSIPNSLLGAGTTWRWRLRCACTITPTIDATGFSPWDTFTVSTLREAEVLELTDLKLFPNPASEMVYVEAQLGLQVVEILDIQGRLLSSESYEGWSNRVAVSLEGLPAGFYQIRATGDRGVQSASLIIE